MKKILTAIILVLLLVSMVTAATFAYPGYMPIADNDKSIQQVTPSRNYIPLIAPKVVAAGSGYVVSASDSQLFVYNINGKYSVYALNLPEGSVVTELAVTDSIITVLFDYQDTTTGYQLLSTIDGTPIPTEGVAIPSDIVSIDQDGTSIYMKDIANNLIRLTFGGVLSAENVVLPQKNIFAQSSVFDVKSGEIYVYSKASKIVKLSDAAAVEIAAIAGIIDFSMTDMGIVSLSKSGIGYYDIASTTEYTHLAGVYGGTAVMDGVIYASQTAVNQVVMATAVGGSVKLSGDFLGDKGDSVDRFNTPTDIAIYGDQLYIADSGNKRISSLNLKTDERSVFSLNEVEPRLITAYNNEIAVADSNNIIRCYSRDISNTISQVFTRDLSGYGKIIDVENFKGIIIALMDNGKIYAIANGQETKEYLSSPGAKAISVNEVSQYMYIMGEDVTTRFNLVASEVDKKDYLINARQYSGIAVDFVGTAYYVSGGAIDKYTRSNHEYTVGESYTLGMATPSIKMHLNTGDMYILDRAGHRLMRYTSHTIGSLSLNDMGYTHPTEDGFDQNIAYITTMGATLYAAPNNDEAVTTIASNQMFYVLAKVSHNGKDYAYGVQYAQQDTKYYIELSALQPLQRVDYADNHPPMTPIFPSGAAVYKYPYRGSEIIATAAKGTQIYLSHDVASDGGKHLWQWYGVRYKSEAGGVVTGYIQKTDIYYSSVVSPPKNRDYLKVQADNYGEVVKMFKEPNDASEVLYGDLSDGTKVILGSEEFDLSAEYTKVIYDNKVGYIKTAHLILEGLTRSEITTIIVVTVSIVVLLLLVVLLVLRKKLFKKKNKSVGVMQ